MRRPAGQWALAGAAALALGFAAAGSAHAYTRSTTSTSSATPIAWDLDNEGTFLPNVSDRQVGYRLDPAGSDDIADGSDLAAVARAFRTWSSVTGSALRFFDDGPASGRTTLNDGEFCVFWNEASTVIDQGTASADDDMSIAGALAVAFVYRRASGPEAGEIIDANIVFNGAQFAWTTDPAAHPSRYDVESVALHEIGHALGLDHSPVAASTLFPRMSTGHGRPRSLDADDVAGVIAAYPGGNSAANRSVLKGNLTASGHGVAGGMVWALDAQGRVAAHAMTLKDGSYHMGGLWPGPYTVFAQPLNAPSGFYLFAETNLGPYFGGSDGAFRATGGAGVTLLPGEEISLDLATLAGPPALDLKLVGRNGSFSNVGTWARRGENNLTIAVAGTGLAATGTSLSVTGPGVSILSTSTSTVAGLPAVSVRLSVAADAPLGARDLVVASGGQRAAVLGGLEILFPPSSGPPPAVGGLRVALVGGWVDLAWDPAPRAEGYRLYRGSLATLRAAGYDHQPAAADGGCYLAVTDASLRDDAATGEALYYLVTALAPPAAGSAGAGSAGQARPAVPGGCP